MIKKILSLTLIFYIFSCTFNPNKYGAVQTYGDSNSFIFKVSDEYSKEHESSLKDDTNPELSKAESKLLSALLSQKDLCQKNSIRPSFSITSKQEKVYDITYAKLIQENYNVKSITPLTFYGRCK